MPHLSKRLQKIAFIFGGIWALLLVAFLGVKYFLPYSIPPLPESDIYTDHTGKEIAEVAYDSKIRHQDLSFDEIPVFYRDALVALEDRSFWSNQGISPKGIIRSTVANLSTGQFVQWGSTITSQLVRNIEWVEKSRSFGRKILEFIYAIRLTGKYSKQEILTAYINRVAYGRLSYGLASAAKVYFAKTPNTLTKAEQIALLILPRNPRAYDPKQEGEAFRARFETVTHMLEQEHIITDTEAESILAEPLAYRKSPNSLPYVIDFLEKNSIPAGPTTFDIDFTSHIDDLAKSVLMEIGWKNVTDYGVIIADRDTNELRTMIGWVSYSNSENGQVNAALAPRQVWSTLKPFIYLLAARDFGITANDSVLDLPVSYKTADDYSYEPKNYSKDFKGIITYAEALAESVNIPAVTTLEKIGIQKLLDFLHTLGVHSLTDTPEHYGLSLALGSGEISLFELTQAYSIFSNSGSYCPFVIQAWKTKNCEPRVDKKYTDIIESILTSRENKMRSFPINSALDFSDRKVFVKTGTSRNFRDNWAVGYTDHYLIGVWSGNKNAENMKGVSGATGAWEIFARIVRDLEPINDHIVPEVAAQNMTEFISIVSPLNGSVYRIESSRPLSLQTLKLTSKTNIAHDSEAWYLDNKKVEWTFIPLSLWEHVIRYEILRDNQVIKTTETRYRVEE